MSRSEDNGSGASAVKAHAMSFAGVSQRDARLDVFRGLALVMIFINHVPGTIFEDFTNRNFGFSDAAEGFVFMSGMAAGLAYSRQFKEGRLWPAVARVWARARTLYFVHIAITMMAIGVFAFAAQHYGVFEMLHKNNMEPIFQNPLGAMVGISTLGHQLGYFNILPLYLVLLLAAPVFIVIGLRSPWLLAGVSFLIWLVAGQFRLNLPNYPNQGGWFFNPIAWQFIFVVGLLTGMALKNGQRFIPKHPALVWASGLFLVFCVLWLKVPAIGEAGRDALGVLRDWGTPFYVVNFDKTFLAVPRLLHALALFYFLSYFAFVRKASESFWAWPLDMLGKHALPVFATGSVLSVTAQTIKEGLDLNIWENAVLLAIGLAIQLTLAYVLDVSGRVTKVDAKERADARKRDDAERKRQAVEADNGATIVPMPAGGNRPPMPVAQIS